jgi:protoheme IX farnesyltransferase
MKDARAAIAPVPLAAAPRSSAAIADYVELAKPRLNLLVVVTSAGGFYLGAGGIPSLFPLVAASVGTALVAGGASALNQVYERDTDALMDRTRSRPLPAGRVAPEDARTFGVSLSVIGLGILGSATNVLAALLALATLIVYLAVYTPLKRRSPMATLVGAVPGALPPLIGWTAGRGAPTLEGWVLFAIVFLWQIPHFMAIAWIYRDDYRKARFPTLSVLEPAGHRAGLHAVLYAAALLPVSLAPTAVGLAGWTYFWIALVLGAALVWVAARFASTRSDASARLLFFGSITYLPLVWAAMMIDH